MGKSSNQVIGYKYFTNFLLFIGNPIEKMLGINFDKRGWLTPLIDEAGNPLAQGVIDSQALYGETEGGVAGQIHARYGTDNQEVLPFYKEYMESKGLQASAYPFQSYLAFPDFYVGNSGYMKEMLLWPKRTRIRNDGRRQWYEVRGDGAVVCEIGEYKQVKAPQSRSNTSAGSLNLEHRRHTKHNNSTVQSSPEKLDYWPDHNMEWHFSDAVSYGLFVVSPGSSDSLEIIENVIIERESLPICIFEVTLHQLEI